MVLPAPSILTLWRAQPVKGDPGGISRSCIFFYTRNYFHIPISEKMNPRYVELESSDKSISGLYSAISQRIWDYFASSVHELTVNYQQNITFLYIINGLLL